MDFPVHRAEHLALARSRTAPPRGPSEVKEEEHKRQLAWINWLRTRTGKSLSALSTEARISHNVLTRFADRGGAVLSGMTIRLLSEATGLPGPDIYQLPSSGFAEEAEPFAPATLDDQVTARIIESLLKDRPNAASWHLRTRALEDVGYLPGDILITDNAVRPFAGEPVVAQVYDLRGSTETIFRLYEPPYLVGATRSDPELRKPLLIDDQRVIVMGPITQSFRPRRR